MQIRLSLTSVFLLLLLTGCGLISIGYNYADAYLRYSINSYATFNEVQKETIKKEVSIFMVWHRKNMLPEYISFLKELQQLVQSGAAIKKEEVGRLRLEVRAMYVKTLQPTLKPAARLMSGVEQEQIEEMAKAFDKENKKQKEKETSGSLDEQLRKRSERTVDFLENLVGNFSDDQLRKIRKLSSELPYATGIYIRLKEDNQARLLEMMRAKANEEDILAFLSGWLFRPETNRSADENSKVFAFENASDEMIVHVFEMLTERQKKTLLKNIMKNIDTFQELATQS